MSVYSRANLRQCLEQLRYVMPDAAADKTTTLQLLKRAKLHITVSYPFISSPIFVLVVVIAVMYYFHNFVYSIVFT